MELQDGDPTATDAWIGDMPPGSHAAPYSIQRAAWVGLYLYDIGNGTWNHAAYAYRENG